MIISVWKPKTKLIDKKQVIIYYTLVDKEDIFKKGTSNFRVVYFCDKEDCKNKEKVFSISRHHLNQERSNTLNEKVQICKSCQTKGINNPRWNDNRSWLELHGVEKSKKLKNELKERMKVNNPSKIESVKEKKIRTNLEKWGVENVFQSEEIKEKIKVTNIEKFGYDSFTKTDEYREKSKITSLQNWGVDHPMKCDEVVEKSKKTNLEKYGFTSHTKTKEYKLNRKDHTKSEIFRKERFKITKDSDYIKYLGESISLFSCKEGHNFKIKSDNYLSRRSNNTPLCTICNPIGDKRSIKESELFEFIKDNYDCKIIRSYRDGLEIDIYLPDLKIGFEFNGLYWHSDEFRDKKYHFNKTLFFEKRGIKIFHIWEDDWDDKKEIVKSMILNKIGKTPYKISARKCEIREIKDIGVVKKFINENHIQGFVGSVSKIGLFHDDTLVSLMMFDNFEGRKKTNENEWNISRFCNLRNHNVTGGFSKLLKYFIKKNKPERIITYADKTYSFGDLYYKNGFTILKNISYDYKYLINNKRINKSKFRKKNLNTGLSESLEMSISGIYRIWDSGKIKFEINIT
jgi:hypothetical protein